MKKLPRASKGGGNDFNLEMITSVDATSQMFVKGTCDSWSDEALQKGEVIDYRQGVLLQTTIRADNTLPRNLWLKCCNEGNLTVHPECRPIRFQWFIPTKLPVKFCRVSGYLDAWRFTGTVRNLFIAPEKLSKLKEYALPRFDEHNGKNVPLETFNQLTEDAPKMCFRKVGLNGELLGDGQSQWGEYGRVAAVWCN